MGRTTYNVSRAGFIADHNSVAKNNGRQIDWSQVPETYMNGTPHTITVNDADAATGDTALTVDALPVAIPRGTVLDFGELAADAYTVTMDATAAEGATSLTVTALPVAIPAGTVLNFGLHSVDSVAMIAVVAADAAAAATSITVTELGHEIEDAATADYPGTVQQQLAKLAADAAAGATALTVEPLAGPIVDDATATYIAGGTGDKTILAGTIMAELSGGKLVPRKDRPGSETATGILETSATEDNREDALTGYGIIVGGVIYQNLLPEDGDSFFATAIGELETAGVGLGWVWETYADDRAS